MELRTPNRVVVRTASPPDGIVLIEVHNSGEELAHIPTINSFPPIVFFFRAPSGRSTSAAIGSGIPHGQVRRGEEPIKAGGFRRWEVPLSWLLVPREEGSYEMNASLALGSDVELAAAGRFSVAFAGGRSETLERCRASWPSQLCVDFEPGATCLRLRRSFWRDSTVDLQESSVVNVTSLGAGALVVVRDPTDALDIVLLNPDGTGIGEWGLAQLLSDRGTGAVDAARYVIGGGSWVNWLPDRWDGASAPFDRDGRPTVVVRSDDPLQLRLIVPLLYSDGRRDSVALDLPP
jgi:hypothetical protein